MFGKIFSNLGESGGQSVQARQAHRSYMRIADGDAAYDTAAEVYGLIGAVGTFWRIWQMTVPAQTLIRWGFGSPALPENQGYLWFAAMKVTTGFDVGMLRIGQESHSGFQKLVVAEMPDDALHTQTNTSLATATPINRQDMIAFPEKVEFPYVKEDSRLFLEYNPEVLVAEDAAGFSIPVTVIE
jgi:hypothetical protein